MTTFSIPKFKVLDKIEVEKKKQSRKKSVIIVSSPLKLGGVIVLDISTKRGVMKKLLRNRGLVERGVSKLFHQFSLRKACFHYYWIFLSGKYSRLL